MDAEAAPMAAPTIVAREQGPSPPVPTTSLTDVALDETPQLPQAPAAAAPSTLDDHAAAEQALPMHGAEPAVYHLPGGMQVPEEEPLGQLLTRLRRAGDRCIEGMDYVGGLVAGFLGVTDSRFQYVLDQVSNEDLAAAEAELEHSRSEPPLLLEEIGQQEQAAAAGTGTESGSRAGRDAAALGDGRV